MATEMLEAPTLTRAGNSEQRTRLNYLDGVRAVAALYVILHHAYLTMWQWDHNKRPSGIMAKLAPAFWYGHYAVSAFIVVSGFCLMLPVVRANGMLKGGIGGFFVRRVRRILPPYYAAIALSLLLIHFCIGQFTGTQWDYSITVTKVDLIAHLLLVHDFLANSASINHAMWSIAVESQIYLVFPLLVLGWRRLGSARVTVIVFFVVWCIWSSGVVNTTRAAGVLPQYTALFTLGMLGAAISTSSQANWKTLRDRMPWTFITVALVVALVSYYHNSGGWWGVFYADMLMGALVVSCLIAGSKSGPNPVRAIFGWKPLAFVGSFSYSLYLIHAPLVQVIWQYGIQPLNLRENVAFLALCVASILLIVCAAYAFYLVFERPFVSNNAGIVLPRIFRIPWPKSATSRRSANPTLAIASPKVRPEE